VKIKAYNVFLVSLSHHITLCSGLNVSQNGLPFRNVHLFTIIAGTTVTIRHCYATFDVIPNRARYFIILGRRDARNLVTQFYAKQRFD